MAETQTTLTAVVRLEIRMLLITASTYFFPAQKKFDGHDCHRIYRGADGFRLAQPEPNGSCFRPIPETPAERSPTAR